MRIQYGIDANEKKRTGRNKTVEWHESTAVNGHKLIVGMSGSGKSYRIKNIALQIAATTRNPVRIHVMDTEGDLAVEGCSEVMFSEQSEFGLNPLELNPDPHMGGPRKATEKFIRTINRSGRILGSKQEYLVRTLVSEVYADLGFNPEDASTWRASDHLSYLYHPEHPERVYVDVPYSEREEAKNVARSLTWDDVKRSWWIDKRHYHGSIAAWPRKMTGRRYPTLKDVIRKADILAKQVFLGTSREAVLDLEEVSKEARKMAAISKKYQRAAKTRNDAEMEAQQEKFDKACEKAKSSFCKYLDGDLIGSELNNAISYATKETVTSVRERLENLQASGIFKSTPPNFDQNAVVWRYKLKSLSIEEKRLFIGFTLNKMIEQAYTNGEQPHIRDIVVVDEAHYFFDQDPENPLNLMAKVGRKFGLSLICASQSVEHFSKDFLSSVSTTIILGLNKPFWPDAIKKLGVREEAIRWVRMRQTALIQIADAETGQGVWYPTVLPQVRQANPQLRAINDGG